MTNRPHHIHRWLVSLLTAALVALALSVPAPAGAQIPADQMTTTQPDEGGLRFHHLKRYRPAIAQMVERGPVILRRMEAALGLEDMPTVEVWVVPRVSDYFEFHDISDRAPKWAVGLSFSGKHEVIVAHGGQRAPGEAMTTFAHELAHVAVDHARQGKPVPRWFHEGFAVMMADQWTPERSERLAVAASGDNLTRFDDLWETFPGHQYSASLAYDQSFHFVRWLRAEHGEDLFARVMERVRDGADFRAALEAETGASFAAVEAVWGDSISDATSFWAILRDDFTIFFGAGLLFLIAYGIVRRRRRRQFDEIEDDDIPEEWDYDASRYPLPGGDADS